MGCGSSDADESSSAPDASSGSAIEAGPVERCIVDLHGKGEDGGPTAVDGVVAAVRPDGNAEGWGARQWLYFPETNYVDARDTVIRSLDDAGCESGVVHGFSNGASFAAKLYCTGEDLGDRVVGYVVDDPVVDDSSTSCAPSADTPVVLYWTGALSTESAPGTSCADMDWTCEGGTTVGIDLYAERLGTTAIASVHDDHRRYDDAPPIERYAQTGRFEPSVTD